jgi:hypothetical protein
MEYFALSRSRCLKHHYGCSIIREISTKVGPIQIKGKELTLTIGSSSTARE